MYLAFRRERFCVIWQSSGFKAISRNGTWEGTRAKEFACLGEELCDIVIGAQVYLEKFYSHFGFVRDGEPYDDVGVPHLRMRLRPRGALL